MYIYITKYKKHVINVVVSPCADPVGTVSIRASSNSPSTSMRSTSWKSPKNKNSRSKLPHCITLYHIVRTHHIRFVVMQISTGDSRHWKGILQAEHLFEHCVFKPVEIWIGPKLYELVSFIKVPKAQVPPLVPLFQTGQIFCTRCLHQGTFRLRCYFLQRSVVTLCHGHHFAMCPFQEEEEDDLVSRAICSAVADCKYSVSCLIAEQAVS